MRLTYHPAAEAELLAAVRSYEAKAAGLGDDFLREFDRAVSKILDAPERPRLLEGGVRRLFMRRFPFHIYYRVEGEGLRVLIVKHQSRHPDYGKSRSGSDS